MEFNVNVNVKLGLDSELATIIKGVCLPRLLDSIVSHSENAIYEERKKEEPEKPSRKKKKEVAPPSEPADAGAAEPAPIENVESDAPASDLPFNEAEEKPLPFVAIWNPEDARKARKRRMEEIEDSVPADIKDEVHKQMVKITKLYLNSAAYEHKRDDMGNALNADGLPVKKLDELNSNETLRFMYLCESMHYDDVQKKVFPFEHLEECLDDCPDWETVERAFVISYNKK